jgi:hypothetical protein
VHAPDDRKILIRKLKINARNPEIVLICFREISTQELPVATVTATATTGRYYKNFYGVVNNTVVLPAMYNPRLIFVSKAGAYPSRAPTLL